MELVRSLAHETGLKAGTVAGRLRRGWSEERIRSTPCRYDLNLVGQIFGKLTVLSEAPMRNRCRLWRCRCGCPLHNEVVVSTTDLQCGKRVCCGCTTHNSELENKIIKAFCSYRKNAETRDLILTITREQFASLVTQRCHYCGRTPEERSCLINGVDRLDNAVGYVWDNCVPCCFECNRAKCKMGAEAFYAWVQQVYGHCVKMGHIKPNTLTAPSTFEGGSGI